MATYKKNEYIKTADLEARLKELYNDIEEMKHTPKTAILNLLNEFKGKVITYEPREEIEVYKFMEVR